MKHIPRGIPASDSISLARQYIHAWAAELIMNGKADMLLSKKEKDVTVELEEYRNSLLKYRYEQHYIAEYLDTVVTDAQIVEHYNNNQGLYKLDFPILKARYLRISGKSPLKEELVKLLSSGDEYDLYVLDSLSYTVADRYIDYGDRWIDIITLSREFGMDYGTLIAAMDGSFIDITDDLGTNHIAYVGEYVPGGRIPPLEYCRDKVKEMVIGQRKYMLFSNLERELLDDAVKNGNFVIYDTD